MLGWLIIVRDGPPDCGDSDAHELARWESSASGLDWLDALESEGAASCVSRHGYPTRFLVPAECVLPYLRSGHPPLHDGPSVIGDDYVTPPGWSGPMTIHKDRLNGCNIQVTWTVDAWDQS
ncbi:hypothetical protein [Roseateles sp.]|uniref:hypothetical protein n=1 Tax=Roseateles sp. TaxID=1971397 RepID=UPI003BAADE93